MASTIDDLSIMDAFGEIGVFVRVVEARSFTRAGRLLGLTPSGVSRIVARLEDRLGARLLQRTTRSISLTDDGAAYYDRCSRILLELEDANLALDRARRVPRGRLRVDAPAILGTYILGPVMPRFLARYPDLSVDFSVRDHLIDPVAEGVDVVVRMADLRESDLVSKKLGALRLVFAGSPGYLAKHGRPQTPADLEKHGAIGLLVNGAVLPHRIRAGSGETTMPMGGRFHTNSADACRMAAVAGIGLVQAFEFHIRDELRSGALEVVLRQHEPAPRPIYALYARHKVTMPKVRAFLEFLSEVVGAAAKDEKRRGV